MNKEQQKAFDKIKEGSNVFLCGQAGTGKSYSINHIVKWARENGLYYGITATTGSSGILIGGTTVNSYLGIGIGNKSAKELFNTIKLKKKFVYNRLLRLQLLIIDEISMMDSQLFDLISELLGLIKGNNLPFGGIQILLCGDLFQLPPVKNKHFFKSVSWPTLDIQTIELLESQRHKDDVAFIQILESLRRGICSKETIKLLKSTRNNIFADDIEPTILYTRNVDVDELNLQKYEELIRNGARSFEYPLKLSTEPIRAWAQSCKIPDMCKLCVGAQVVLTWNIDLELGLCNGARGIVMDIGLKGVTVKFMSGLTTVIKYNRVKEDNNENTWIEFMPLRLAYALTINKSQGMTLDCAIICFDKDVNYESDFMYGRAYTALSRVRNLKNLRLINVTSELFRAHPDVLEFYENI